MPVFGIVTRFFLPTWQNYTFPGKSSGDLTADQDLMAVACAAPLSYA